VTKPRNGKDLVGPSSTVRLYPGVQAPFLDGELPNRAGVMAVSICEPGAFVDDVRAAVRERRYRGSLDFFEEAFTWQEEFSTKAQSPLCSKRLNDYAYITLEHVRKGYSNAMDSIWQATPQLFTW
jgi:hypothetical protein